MALSTRYRYSGICAALRISDGFGRGVLRRVLFERAKSPVSATTAVIFFQLIELAQSR